MNRYFEMLKQYVISGGQVPRKESRIFTPLAFIVGFLLGYVVIFVGYSGLVVIIGVIIGICGLYMLIPSIAVSVSRLHNANRSGWWLLISLIPFVGSTVLLGFVAKDSQPNENQGGCNPEDAIT